MYSMNVKYYNLVSNIYGIDYSKEPLEYIHRLYIFWELILESYLLNCHTL